jgi:hypothetical protein
MDLETISDVTSLAVTRIVFIDQDYQKAVRCSVDNTVTNAWKQYNSTAGFVIFSSHQFSFTF